MVRREKLDTIHSYELLLGDENVFLYFMYQTWCERLDSNSEDVERLCCLYLWQNKYALIRKIYSTSELPTKYKRCKWAKYFFHP